MGRLPLASGLAVVALSAAATSLVVFGSTLAAAAFAITAFMSWTKPFDHVRAEGKPSLSTGGRIAVGMTLSVIGVVLLVGQDEISSASKPAASPSFVKTDAIDACKRGVVARASHPSTVEFPTLDYDFRTLADDKSELRMSAKARNGFNLLVEFDVVCDFTSGRLDGAVMYEAGPR